MTRDEQDTPSVEAADPGHLIDPAGDGPAPSGVAPVGALAAGPSAQKRFDAQWSDYVFAAPYLLLFGVFLLYPLAQGLVLSFMQYDLVSPEPPTFNGVSNYLEAFGDEYFWNAMWASTLFVALCSPLTIGVALVLATLTDAVPGVRQHFYRVAIFTPTILTVSVAALLWRWLYNTEFGPLNAIFEVVGLPRIAWLNAPWTAMFSLVLMTLWWTIGGPVLILLAGLKAIPEQYYEAAAIDGATGWRSFFAITLPLLRPALLFVMVLNIIGGFQVFGQAFLITGGGPGISTRVMVQYIYETAFRGYRLGYGAAMSWLLFTVIAFFAVAQFRLMREKN